MGFEDKLLKSIDYKDKNPINDIDRVSRLCENLKNKINRERPSPESFEDLIDSGDIKREMDIVKSLEEKWHSDNSPESKHAKNLSDIAEFAIHLSVGGWTDAKINSILSSKPDDYLRKIDLILEISKNDETSFLPLGIDVVIVGKNGMSGLDSKLEFLKKELKSGSECLVKYVETESFRGSIEAPRAVVAISSEHVNDYIKILESNSLEKINTHITKYIILYQLQTQYHRFYRIAEKLGHNNIAYDYAQINNIAFEVFEPLYNDIQSDVRLSSKVSQDIGVKYIDSFLDDFDREIGL